MHPSARRPLLRLISIVGLFLLLAPAAPATPAAARGWDPAAPLVPGVLLVSLRPAARLDGEGAALKASPASLAYLAGSAGVAGAEELGAGSSTYRVILAPGTDPRAAAARLEQSPYVAYVEPSYVYEKTLTPNDPMYSQQWALPQIKADKAWDITTGSDQIIIAILDTGVDKSHPDLEGKLVPGYDFVNKDEDPSDDQGHGTYTAGIAAARGNNAVGIAGVAWGARVMPIKVLSSDGRGSADTLVPGIRWAVDHGARVISMSFGGASFSQAMADAVKYAIDKGAVVVAAAGNDPDGKPEYPAAFDNVVAVAATARADQVTGFSSFGSYVTLGAPGVGIFSTAWSGTGQQYEAANGTSASCPFVSGVAALMLSARPDLTNLQVKALLEGTVDHGPELGWNEHTGYGRVNALAAVSAARDNQLNAGRESSVQGKVAGAAPERVILTLASARDRKQARPAADGAFRFDGLIAGRYTLAIDAPGYAIARQMDPVVVDGTPRDVKTVDISLSPVPASPFSRVAVSSSTAEQWYFPETGHTLASGFRAFWDENGGLARFGYPISEEFTEGQYTVQYFERSRFEYHSENQGTPYEVELGLLGRAVTAGRTFKPAAPTANTNALLYFAETGHTLRGSFLQTWRDGGGLPVFGYPISEEILEGAFRVQYFERGRFEHHPELPPPHQVSFGLLGRDYARMQGYQLP